LADRVVQQVEGTLGRLPQRVQGKVQGGLQGEPGFEKAAGDLGQRVLEPLPRRLLCAVGSAGETGGIGAREPADRVRALRRRRGTV
jgi:hypothetical protein